MFLNNVIMVIIHEDTLNMTTTAGEKKKSWKQTQISQKVSVISILILCIAWFEEQDSLQIKKKNRSEGAS